MVELGKPIHTFDAAAVHDGRIIVRRATRRGAVRDARPRRARARPGDAASSPTRPGRSGSPASWAAPRRRSATATTDVVVESAIFDPISIRRTAFRYALRSEASLRFEKGQEFRLARVGADRTARLIAEWAGGAGRAGRRSTPTRPSRAPARVAFRPARVNRLLGTATRGRRAARAARAGRDRDRRPRAPGTRDPRSPRAPSRSTSSAGDGRASSRRPSRPGGATSRSRRTSPRRSSASAATSSSRPRLPAHADADRTATIRSAVRTAVRETLVGAGLTEVVTLRPRRARGSSSGSRRTTTARPTTSPSSEPAGRPVIVTNPLSSQHSVLRQSLDRQPARGRLDEPPPRPRRRRDLRGRQGLRRARTTADPRVVAARLRADRRGRAAGLGPAGPAVRPRRREGRHRAASAGGSAARRPAFSRSPTTRTSTPAGPPGSTAGGAPRRPASGELHPGTSSPRSTCAPSGSYVAELAVAGLAGGQPTPYRVDGAVAAADRRARPRDHRRRGPPGGRGRGRHPAPRRPAAPGRGAVRHLPRATAGRDRQEPRLPADAARRRADADRGRARRGGRRRRSPA